VVHREVLSDWVCKHPQLARLLGCPTTTGRLSLHGLGDTIDKAHKRTTTASEGTQFWHEVHGASGSALRLFRTGGGLLGLGPAWSERGDEFWVLAGAQEPFILRRRAWGGHRLVGEAYVHGMMHMRHSERLGDLRHPEHTVLT
jgi:hypothetical protein